MTTAIQKIDGRGLAINDMADMNAAVAMIVTSNLCPKQYVGKPKDAIIAILAGRQVGWGPIQSLQHIAVINGRPSMYGDGPTGLAAASGKVEYIKEWFEQAGKPVDEPNYTSLRDYPDNLAACWQAKRKDNSEPTKIVRFSVADAKVAGLWGKTGPWTQYPKRMLTCRARAWGLRDTFSDALQGISQAEEWADMTPAKTIDPLEARLTAKQVESTVVATEMPLLPAQDAPGTTISVPGDTDTHLQTTSAHTLAQARMDLSGAVAQYILTRKAAGNVGTPLSADDLIKAVSAVELPGAKGFKSVEEMAKVGSAILAGKFDLETGDKLP